MGRAIVIIVVFFALLAAARAAWVIYNTGDDYRAMESASKALAPYGASIAVSADCERWLTGEDTRGAFAAKSLAPSPTKFSFAKVNIPQVGETTMVFDASPRELLLMRSGQENWLAERGDWILQVGTAGLLGITPASLKPAAPVGLDSALNLVTALGRNESNVVALSRSQGVVYMTQIAGSAMLVCGERSGCAFIEKGVGKIADPEQLAGVKKTWNRATLNAVGAACKSLSDTELRAALDRFEAVQGACHGQADIMALKTAYRERVADCAVYSGKIAPLAEAFFTMP